LEECINNHPACHISASDVAYMPTRVLDLGVVDDKNLEVPSTAPIRLVESTHIVEDRSYACLSHRWDSLRHTIITEQATYTRHKDGLRFEDLDLDYQDTVHIMRRLCMRYLWIDSLCIIQDSVEDWESESKTMATVYNRALFTLARQCNSTTSLRCIPKIGHLVSDPSISPPIYARPAFVHIWDLRIRDPERFQLEKRGWVYQERLLSPRTIHLSDQEIYWECYEMSSCQCSRENPYGSLHNALPKVHHAKALFLGNLTTKPDAATLRKRWRHIVEEYSSLDLAKSSDRLYAIQGCADQIGEHLKESYHFGLWQDDLLGDLAWTSSGDRHKPRPTGQHCTPTWSWASIDEKVHYWSLDIDEGLPHVQLATEPAPDESHLTPSILLLTGQLLPANLKIAKSAETYDRDTWDWDGIRIEVNSDLLKDNSDSTWLTKPESYSYFWKDFEMRTADWDFEVQYDISLLLLGRLTSYSQGEHCLVLWRYGRGIPGSGLERETVDNHPIYQRIGMLQIKVREGPVSNWSKVGEKGSGASLDWSKADKVAIAIE
jgi:hypothetical protein